jgi:hypothetical protein
LVKKKKKRGIAENGIAVAGSKELTRTGLEVEVTLPDL